MSWEHLYVYKGGDEDDDDKTQSRIPEWLKMGGGLILAILVVTLILEYGFNYKLFYYKIFNTANSKTKEEEDKAASTETADKAASTSASDKAAST